MNARKRSTWSRRTRRQIPVVRAISLVLLFGIPAIGLFCLQWPGPAPSPLPSQHSLSDEITLAPKAALDAPPDSGDPLAQAQAASPFGKMASPLNARTRTMLERVADPFYEAFAAGVTRGVLVLQSTGGGVPTYSLPSSTRQATSPSDRAILKEIRLSLGIPSTKTRTYSSTAASVDAGKQKADPIDENPFAKPVGETAGSASQPANSTAAAPKQDAVPAKQETDPAKAVSSAVSESKAASDPAAATNQNAVAAPDTAGKESRPTPIPVATPVAVSDLKPAEVFAPQSQAMTPFRTSAPVISDSTPSSGIRPYKLLKVGADGSLRMVPATRIDAHTFESAEFGTMSMNLLYFPKPAETGTAIVIADFNGDGIPDVCFHNATEGFLHVFYGNPDGTQTEVMKVEMGTGLRSLAAGDFNRDGHADIAVSNVWTGTLTILYLRDADNAPLYRTIYYSSHPDFVVAADTTGSGNTDLLAANFANSAEVLDIDVADGATPGTKITLDSVFNQPVSLSCGYQLQLNAVQYKSNLSLSLQNFRADFVNVLNVQAGNEYFIIVGDVNSDNSMAVVLATPRK